MHSTAAPAVPGQETDTDGGESEDSTKSSKSSRRKAKAKARAPASPARRSLWGGAFSSRLIRFAAAAEVLTQAQPGAAFRASVVPTKVAS